MLRQVTTMGNSESVMGGLVRPRTTFRVVHTDAMSIDKTRANSLRLIMISLNNRLEIGYMCFGEIDGDVFLSQHGLKVVLC
jgi:hypothetical protein